MKSLKKDRAKLIKAKSLLEKKIADYKKFSDFIQNVCFTF